MIYQHLKQKPLIKFLLVFSTITLAVAGVVWACADAGEEDYSAFSPEYFVAKEYSPFFYDSETTYYDAYDIDYADDSNIRYNNMVVDEWYTYLKHRLTRASIKSLLFTTSYNGIDSIYHRPGNSDFFRMLDKQQSDQFFSYLLLAKSCEKFTVRDQSAYWDKPAPVQVPAELEATISAALKASADPFIKERLWFQLVRYEYFKDVFSKDSLTMNHQTPDAFNQYKAEFPHNLIYYRTLGYVGGYYYHHKKYAQANYLYSLCYDYCYEMKIPSKWSFHPQDESDWNATLRLARTNSEKITLWHLLGMQYDPALAIRKIVVLDPKSDKLDLLLSRLVNIRESAPADSIKADSAALEAAEEIKMVDSIALRNNTAKPYYWNLAAGYLNYLCKNYAAAADYYNKAKKQFPSGDPVLIAQGKLLDVLLYVGSLKQIDGRAESHLVGPLNWLADLRDGKDSVKYLRFQWPLSRCTAKLAELYRKQHDAVKELCFKSSTNFYLDSINVEKLKCLLQKPVKTPYEQVLLRYYPLKAPDLYYYQATVQVYKENLPKAITFMKLAKRLNSVTLPANPFISRIIDCHDFDQAARQIQTFTPLSFLQRMQLLQNNLKAGKNRYQNAFQLANAYYNITHYGNDRAFYQSSIAGDNATQPSDIYKPFRHWFASSRLAQKYYLIARRFAVNKEQQARCTFMAAKCEHNAYYTSAFNYAEQNGTYNAENIVPPPGKYFAELKANYSKSLFYKEAIQECGYFKQFVEKKNTDVAETWRHLAKPRRESRNLVSMLKVYL